MNESLETEFYNPDVLSISQLAKMHAAISESKDIAPALIYRDPNFEVYLQKFLLNSKEDFIIMLMDQGLFAGFCRLKRNNDTLFLNNIYIAKNAQGKGYGGFLCLEAINKVLEEGEFKFFQLDVFQSNERAYKWYINLGFEEVQRTYWYEIIPPSSGSSEVDYDKDDKGFTAIYKEDKRIGSLINNAVVVLPDTEGLKYLSSYGGKRVFLKTSEPYTNEILNPVLVDISIRLSQPLQDAITNLTKDIERKKN